MQRGDFFGQPKALLRPACARGNSGEVSRSRRVQLRGSGEVMVGHGGPVVSLQPIEAPLSYL